MRELRVFSPQEEFKYMNCFILQKSTKIISQ